MSLSSSVGPRRRVTSNVRRAAAVIALGVCLAATMAPDHGPFTLRTGPARTPSIIREQNADEADTAAGIAGDGGQTSRRTGDAAQTATPTPRTGADRPAGGADPTVIVSKVTGPTASIDGQQPSDDEPLARPTTVDQQLPGPQLPGTPNGPSLEGPSPAGPAPEGPGSSDPAPPSPPLSNDPGRPPGPATPDRPDPVEPSGSVLPQAETPQPASAPTPGPAVLDLDQQNCPNLGRVAIGDATGAPTEAVRATGRFRAMAAGLQRGQLTCADPLQRWRDDLVIQELWTGGLRDGFLVGGLAETDPVMYFPAFEFRTFHFRDGGPSNHNFAGVPTGTTSIGAHRVVLTTRGGLVFERHGEPGLAVVSGAWPVWIAHGGPSGEMGLPRSSPAPTRNPDLPAELALDLPLGAFQDFAGGTLILPDVTNDLEAEAMPASHYRWVPLTEAQQAIASPPRNSILKVGGRTFYLDGDGIGHWIHSAGLWNCARHRLGARELVVRGWVLDRFPLGDGFTCPPPP